MAAHAPRQRRSKVATRAGIYRHALIKKGFIRSWWRILLHLCHFGLQLALQLALIIFLMRNFQTPWNNIRLSGLIRICLIFSNVIACAESGIGLAAVLFMYRLLLERNWSRVNQILRTTHRQNQLHAKISLGGILIIVIIYFTANLIDQQHFSVFSDHTLGLGDFRVWAVWLIVILILGKNVMALAAVGAKENLIQADQNQNAVLIVDLMLEAVIFALTLTILHWRLPLVVAFLPFILYSPLKILLINGFCRFHYPWLNLKAQGRTNLRLVNYAKAVMVKKIGYWILTNTDLILILILFNLQRIAIISFFSLFSVALRVLFLRIFRSSTDYLGLAYSWQGRLRWKQNLELNNFCYLGAGLCFVLQLALVPYLVNVFFNDLVVGVVTSTTRTFFRFIFLQPWFALLQAVTSTLILLLEVNNIFIDVNRFHAAVVRGFYVFTALEIVVLLIVTIPVFFLLDSYVYTLIAILTVQITFLFGCYLYLSLLTWWRLTTGVTWPRNIGQPVLLFFGPVLTISLLFLFVVVPNHQLSFASFGADLRSAVLSWRVVKWALYVPGLLGVYSVSVSVSTLVAFYRPLFGYWRYRRPSTSCHPKWQVPLRMANETLSNHSAT